jgi:hypothetical protein
MSFVDLRYIFINPSCPTALGSQNQPLKKASSHEISRLVQKFSLHHPTFKKMLDLFPNIKTEIVAKYVDFYSRSNKEDLSEAFIKLNEAIEFRALHSTIHYDSIKVLEKEHFFYYSGTAKDHSGICFFTLENHTTIKRPSLQQYIHFLIYTIEKEAKKNGHYYSTLVIDRSKTKLENQDLELVRAMFYHVTLLYPGSTRNILLYPASITTKILFTIMKSFLHENVIELVKCIDDKKDFEEYIPEEYIFL